MEGIITENEELLKKDAEPEVRDAGVISGAQRVEHYEIAAYGTVRTYANLLGQHQWAQLLQQTLDEEKQTDSKLNALAERIKVERPKRPNSIVVYVETQHAASLPTATLIRRITRRNLCEFLCCPCRALLFWRWASGTTW